MLRFLWGLMFGAVLGGIAGVAAMYVHYHQKHNEPRASAQPGGDAGVAKKGPARHRRPSTSADPNAPSPVVTAADLKPKAAGDALRAADRTVDMSAGGSEARALTQEEIDGALARQAGAITACITDARAGAAVNGQVVAGVVVGADGSVRRTRVEAPAYLIDHGLYACARSALEALRFPAAGRETVVTVPFDVHE